VSVQGASRHPDLPDLRPLGENEYNVGSSEFHSYLLHSFKLNYSTSLFMALESFGTPNKALKFQPKKVAKRAGSEETEV